MPSLNWEEFQRLPGSADQNFETLCRAIIRLQYGRYGDFRGLANQPGVEFHLKLHTTCAIGVAGEWHGWQCRWYDIPSGRALGATRRKKIIEAVRTTEKVLPGITHWTLWTRYPLTRRDQDWFYAITTKMRLSLATATDAEMLLSGDAEILRGTYFGELVLTPQSLARLHETSAARILPRWLAAVHQQVQVERTLRRMLGEALSWGEMIEVADRLNAAANVMLAETRLAEPLRTPVGNFVGVARTTADLLRQAQDALTNGDFDLLRQTLETRPDPPGRETASVPRFLRAARLAIGFEATNALADLNLAHRLFQDVEQFLGARLVGVLADAGGGKTQLSAELTAAQPDRPAGILLHGRDLHARQNLDDLAHRLVFQGRPFPSIESLVAALDAAGQRARRRLPLVIDGLNEAEDPRDWKAPLASLDVLLRRYPNVLVVVMLRTGARRPDEQFEWGGLRPREIDESVRTVFAEIALPEDVPTFEMTGFGDDTPEAIRRYFKYYRIVADADLPIDLLEHPLTLRMFCEVTNPARAREVGSEAMPRSLTALFERYLNNAMTRIADLAPRSCPYCAQDVRKVIDEIGARLWEQRDRELSESELRAAVGDEKRLWNESIVRLLEQEGVILRVEGDTPGKHNLIPVYDALGGYMIANALLSSLGRAGFRDWIKKPENIAALNGSHEELHPLATDIFRSLVGLVPRRLEREQLWNFLDGQLRNTALLSATRLERDYLDAATVAGIAELVCNPEAPTAIFNRLTRVSGAPNHPLNADFLDGELRKMANADRDLRWTEWVRRQYEEETFGVRNPFGELGFKWRDDPTRTVSDRLRAKWTMWLLTTTARELRDVTTRALYWFGRGDPETLFNLTIEALSISDPYVPERMLAASYGVAMALHASPNRENFTETILPTFARKIYEQMFAPAAPNATTHILMREYARRILQLAALGKRKLFTKEETRCITPPYATGGLREWKEIETDKEEIHGPDSPFRMDFENYTLGRLTPTRSTYDFKDSDYRKVRAQVLWRVQQLGWAAERFKEVDQRIASRRSYYRPVNESLKTDRYGKKYSWIAYHEMAGLRHDAGVLDPRENGDRPWEVDIDPSFPSPCPEGKLVMVDFLGNSSITTSEWIENGAVPKVAPYYHLDAVHGHPGPWIMLDGYLTQEDHARGRRLFCFVRTFLAPRAKVSSLIAALRRQSMRGRWLPEKPSVIYTYAGEIPWCETFPKNGRTMLQFVVKEHKVPVRRRQPALFLDGKRLEISPLAMIRRRLFGIPPDEDTPELRAALERVERRNVIEEVEEIRRETQDFNVLIPVCDFHWEGTTLEQESLHGPTLAKELATALRLTGIPGSLDSATKDGARATCSIAHRSQSYNNSQMFFFIREDLLRKYLRARKLALITVAWGERQLGGKAAELLARDPEKSGPSFKVFHTVSAWK